MGVTNYLLTGMILQVVDRLSLELHHPLKIHWTSASRQKTHGTPSPALATCLYGDGIWGLASWQWCIIYIIYIYTMGPPKP